MIKFWPSWRFALSERFVWFVKQGFAGAILECNGEWAGICTVCCPVGAQMCLNTSWIGLNIICLMPVNQDRSIRPGPAMDYRATS